MPAPDLSGIPPFYHSYLRPVADRDLQQLMDEHLQPLSDSLRGLTEDEWSYAYAPGKWTLKELVQHLIDAERIFSYRALCIAREDPRPLPGFDENAYADNCMANERNGAAILDELNAVVKSTRALFGSFNEKQLAASGVANGAPITVNAVGYIIAGHALHHSRIVRERYLDKKVGAEQG
jgi:hypothetical protein